MSENTTTNNGAAGEPASLAASQKQNNFFNGLLRTAARINAKARKKLHANPEQRTYATAMHKTATSQYRGPKDGGHAARAAVDSGGGSTSLAAAASGQTRKAIINGGCGPLGTVPASTPNGASRFYIEQEARAAANRARLAAPPIKDPGGRGSRADRELYLTQQYRPADDFGRRPTRYPRVSDLPPLIGAIEDLDWREAHLNAFAASQQWADHLKASKPASKPRSLSRPWATPPSEGGSGPLEHWESHRNWRSYDGSESASAVAMNDFSDKELRRMNASWAPPASQRPPTKPAISSRAR